jgi:hypothetical protein
MKLYESQVIVNNEKVRTAIDSLNHEHDKQLTVLSQKLVDAENHKKMVIQTVVKEVPKYVTIKADSSCVITAGWVWTHNKALTPEVSGVSESPPGDVDAPSGIKASQVAGTTADNYAECVTRGRVIQQWQDWYSMTQGEWSTFLLALPPEVEVPK